VHPAPASPAPGPDRDPGSCSAGPFVDLVDWEDWLALDVDEDEAPPEDGKEYLDLSPARAR
jgi:hypothetical protein